MAEQKILVIWQGRISNDQLSFSQKGIITGVTSRGIFIQLDTGRVLFLSFERFRGPLTLNLSGDTSMLKLLDYKSPVVIQDGKITVIYSGLEINYSHAQIWEAPLRSGSLLSPEDRISIIKSAASQILSQKRGSALNRIFANLLNLELNHSVAIKTQFPGADGADLLQLLKTGDVDSILSALRPILGFGVGLTPAGDDLILGLLLAFNRWKSVLRPSFDIARLNDLLIQAASQKTTCLSANLILCAVQGHADERLIYALDGMMTGDPALDQCIRYILAWGDSSGCYALAGMAAAIIASQTELQENS